ncbi:hypothetical protein L7F22_013446 [Adiantum nelumboides]|nr:hypothetical protein [Adiantum nelumboides]
MQSQELVTGLPVFKVADMQKVCEGCQFGKQAKASFPHDKHVSRNVLELVHSDVWGPANIASMGGCTFYVTFIDDHTHKVWVYFMKMKSEVFTHFQNFKAMAKKQTGKYVQCLRPDGGGEYFSNEFSSFLKKHGIQRQFTCRYTSQQNGVAKQKNRHIAEVARALMSEKNVPHCYWAEAVSTAVYIMNRTPTAAVHNVTPEEKFFGKKPDLGHLKVFGCIAYVHVSDELRTKLDPKAEKCPSLQVLSGPQGSSSASAVDKPWSGRLRERESPAISTNVSRKGKEKVDEVPQIPNLSAGFNDGNSSGSEHSLDEEFGIPSVRTPGVKKELQGIHEKLRRFGIHKNPVERLTYDSYVARHCVYMAKLRADEGQVLEDVTMYRQIVGNLIYLTISRPDLSYTVGLESQFMQLPRKPHLDVVRRTLRYVSATLDYALFYEASTELQLSGFTDADWAGSVCDRRSTSGFMFSLGSVAITWSSKKQPIVALSSTEVEYRGATVPACEVAWLELLLGDLGIGRLSFIATTLAAYSWHEAQCFMPGRSILRCTITSSERGSWMAVSTSHL